jgi:RND superfamily putative drug exporter
MTVAERQLGFPAHSPVLVVASGVADPARAAEVERRLRAAAGGQPVVGPEVRDGYAVFELQQPAGDNDDRTHRWLDRIRSTAWPAGVRVQLGGEAPAYQDFLRVLTGDAPVIAGTVLVLTLVLLALAFRSVALPIKAVLMNLLSVAAALGVLTWAFQDGNLAGPLGFQAVGFVDATTPVIVFAGLFGLSMDYEVFLLSRIREEWASGHPNAAAVAFGMERTGRIITSAALILVVVVSTLSFSHLALNKSFGVTFAVAILLDATVIRLLLVPAMMRVLGDVNWWPARQRNVTSIPSAPPARHASRSAASSPAGAHTAGTRER